MVDFFDIMAPISMMITAVMLLVQNIIEDREERKEEEQKKAREAHDEIKRRWREAEER